MTDYSSFSKEKLYQLALDLKLAIAHADSSYLKELTQHMILAINNFDTYVNDPCPRCGKNRREL